MRNYELFNEYPRIMDLTEYIWILALFYESHATYA
jgi:hypothetical protein